jgi:hypothetical protein
MADLSDNQMNLPVCMRRASRPYSFPILPRWAMLATSAAQHSMTQRELVHEVFYGTSRRFTWFRGNRVSFPFLPRAEGKAGSDAEGSSSQSLTFLLLSSSRKSGDAISQLHRRVNGHGWKDSNVFQDNPHCRNGWLKVLAFWRRFFQSWE